MSETDALHTQHLSTALTQAQGWREVLLPYLMQRIGTCERLEANANLAASMRLEAVARKHELIDAVTWLYHQAQLPSPFETMRLGLYTLTLPREAVPAPLSAAQTLPPKRPRPYAGSVA